jgi:hypothetical protein
MMLVWKFVGLSYGCEDWFGHRHICSDVFRALGVLLRVPWICEYQFAPTLIVLYELAELYPGSRHRYNTVMNPGQRYREGLTSRAPEAGGPRSPCDKSPRIVSPCVILLQGTGVGTHQLTGLGLRV